jgi:hypothetical protein
MSAHERSAVFALANDYLVQVDECSSRGLKIRSCDNFEPPFTVLMAPGGVWRRSDQYGPARRGIEELKKDLDLMHARRPGS